MKKIKIGALVSGSGTNLQAIIDACESGAIDGEVVFVGSDKPGAFGLERAKRHNIPTFVVDYVREAMTLNAITATGLLRFGFVPDDYDFNKALEKTGEGPFNEAKYTKLLKRAAIEEALLKEIFKYECDLVVLAGFMHLLTPYFIDVINADQNPPRIMNIHPALLPSFPGIRGYEDAYDYGCKVGGCTVHFVDYGEDTGPIIGQRSFPIFPGENLEEIKRKGLKEEWMLYSECIQLFAQGRLKVKERKMASGKLRKVVEILP